VFIFKLSVFNCLVQINVLHLISKSNSSSAEKEKFSEFVGKTQHLQGWQGV